MAGKINRTIHSTEVHYLDTEGTEKIGTVYGTARISVPYIQKHLDENASNITALYPKDEVYTMSEIDFIKHAKKQEA